MEIMLITFMYILKLVGRANVKWSNKNFKNLLPSILSLNLNTKNTYVIFKSC